VFERGGESLTRGRALFRWRRSPCFPLENGAPGEARTPDILLKRNFRALDLLRRPLRCVLSVAGFVIWPPLLTPPLIKQLGESNGSNDGGDSNPIRPFISLACYRFSVSELGCTSRFIFRGIGPRCQLSCYVLPPFLLWPELIGRGGSRSDRFQVKTNVFVWRSVLWRGAVHIASGSLGKPPEEERSTDLSAHAEQPRAQPGGRTRSPRTC
jgi:hypothetical protein